MDIKAIFEVELPLQLNVLDKGIRPGISPAFGTACAEAFGTACAEAGSVCFEEQGHRCGVALKVGGSYATSHRVYWAGVHEQARPCWSDLQVAVEHGAYGIAFLLIRELTDFTVIERARKGPGFDYWLGHDDGMFQRKARLEVSGIQNGSEGEVNYRAKQKLKQTEPSDNQGFPAYIIVVEFNQPISKVVIK
jgi:hypothetical protein